ncbi:MAG: hypothetical protein GX885_08165 [Methanomicrobiales archaeon]|nr:hypothetical protein [Methanomicrobiales archaeon]
MNFMQEEPPCTGGGAACSEPTGRGEQGNRQDEGSSGPGHPGLEEIFLIMEGF